MLSKYCQNIPAYTITHSKIKNNLMRLLLLWYWKPLWPGKFNVDQERIRSVFWYNVFGPKLLKFALSANCARSSADNTGYWWIFRTHFLPACRQIQESNFAFRIEMPTPLRKLWEDVQILHCPVREHEDKCKHVSQSTQIALSLASLTYLPAMLRTENADNLFNILTSQRLPGSIWIVRRVLW